jgi:toxin-antitoxin system PIN domain toxin
VRNLLDVNILIALLDSDHIFHKQVFTWWDRERQNGWASCPITENGAVRIMSNAKYRPQKPLTPADVIAMLDALIERTDHQFWSDDFSLRDRSVIDQTFLTSAHQLTDIYLLALAAKRGGRLATLDVGIKPAAVRGGSAANLLIVT